DTKLNREVAIKILPEALANDPDYLTRFTREAQVLAALNLWFAKNASGAKTHVSTPIASASREPGRRDAGHVTLRYMVVGGNLNSPLNLLISFAKALMEQGFSLDPFWRRTGPRRRVDHRAATGHIEGARIFEGDGAAWGG